MNLWVGTTVLRTAGSLVHMSSFASLVLLDSWQDGATAGLLMQGQGMLALYFVLRHPDCLFDIMLLSLVLFNPYTKSISNNVRFTSKNFKCSSYLFPSALSTFRSCNIIVCYMDRQQQLASFSSPTPFAHLGPSFLPQSWPQDRCEIALTPWCVLDDFLCLTLQTDIYRIDLELHIDIPELIKVQPIIYLVTNSTL